jgi:hypothetical protein
VEVEIMRTTKALHRAALVAALASAACLGFLADFADARNASSTVLGTIVEVIPGTQTIVVRVGSANGIPVLHRFRVTDSARIRVNGGFARFADLVVGRPVKVAYDVTNGFNAAQIVEVTDAFPAASGVTVNAREEASVERRELYLEQVGSTLDVLDEDIQELAQHPELEGPDELARLKATVDLLKVKLADARRLQGSLSPTVSQDAWRSGVDEMNAVLADLNSAHDIGRAIIANR